MESSLSCNLIIRQDFAISSPFGFCCAIKKSSIIQRGNKRGILATYLHLSFLGLLAGIRGGLFFCQRFHSSGVFILHNKTSLPEYVSFS